MESQKLILRGDTRAHSGKIEVYDGERWISAITVAGNAIIAERRAQDASRIQLEAR